MELKMVATAYGVKANGKKLLDEYRGDRTYGDCFIILKDGKETYEVILSTIGDICNCKAGEHGHDCKHVRMALEYHHKINEAVEAVK
jgi:hypothetical protein